LSLPPQDPPNDGQFATIPVSSDVDVGQLGDHRYSSRGVMLAALGAVMLLAAFLIALKMLFGSTTPDLTRDSFEIALQKWQATGPASYDLEVVIGGAQPGKVHLDVRDGEVTAATRDGRPLPERGWDVWTIPGQFEELEREFEFAENPQKEMQAPPGARVWLRCEFDPKYGYPRRFHRHTTGGAPEVFWENSLVPK
jgi:hypothetical protein